MEGKVTVLTDIDGTKTMFEVKVKNVYGSLLRTQPFGEHVRTSIAGALSKTFPGIVTRVIAQEAVKAEERQDEQAHSVEAYGGSVAILHPADMRERYKEKTGRYPHPAMSFVRLREAVE